MAFCTKCGAKIPDGAKFCNSCGEKFGSSSTSTEEKIVTFVENFDVNEKISELKKAAESSEEVAQIKENLKSNEKVAAFLEKVSWKKLLVAAVVIIAVLKIFGGDGSLGITPEEFQKRYNQNVQVMFEDRGKTFEIGSIRKTEIEDTVVLDFKNVYGGDIYNARMTTYTKKDRGDNLHFLSIEPNDVNVFVVTFAGIAAYSAANEKLASKDELEKSVEMMKGLFREAFQKLNDDPSDKRGIAEIVKNGICYSCYISRTGRGTIVSFGVESTKSPDHKSAKEAFK